MNKIQLEFKNKLCFSFCQDLGNKEIKSEILDKQLNIT